MSNKIAVHNERVKLLATSFNAIALGLIGFAIIRPITDDVWSLKVMSVWWGFSGLVFHALSHYIVGYLKEDAKQ